MSRPAHQVTTLLHSLENEFRLIEEMDPSFADGYRRVYDREAPFELRPCHAGECSDSVGALEGIKVKIVNLEDENQLKSMRIELSSEADLFFHYSCVINKLGFQQLREDQKLMCTFEEFNLTLVKMFNQCIQQPQMYLAVLLLQPKGEATLELLHNLEYKFVNLLVLPFHESDEATIRQHVTYRYNAMRSRLSIMTAKLQDVSALVKIRNPSTLEQLSSGATANVSMHEARDADRGHHSQVAHSHLY